jgi:DNA (cytosine-5)-methyltransferase 1
MKIRVFEAFAGYGSQSLALERLKQTFPEFDYEVVGISEIDKYALTAYEALHGHCPNYGDISKIDWNNVPDFDLFTYSFPCTDISSAGKQEGLKEGSGTRSSLLWECRRAIEIKRPKHLLMENVKALVSEKFLPFFLDWERYLRSLGYMNYSEVLNAKDYGVPQNRERIFMVSTLETETYHFPKPFKLELRLKDVLEQDVPEKYYLSEKAINGFTEHKKRMEARGNGF